MSGVAQAYVDLHADELKPPQPKFLVDWEQGPTLVDDRRDYPDPGFNPQEINPTGDAEHDQYPANPVIAWHNWTYRDPSQSIKPPNVGSTNIGIRAGLEQQIGKQLAPIQYPNQTTQAPADWDDGIQVLPQEATSNAVEAQRLQLQQLLDGYNPSAIQ